MSNSLYLSFAPQLLKDVALLIVATGLRIGEVVALQWSDIHLEPANGAGFGYLQVRREKSKNARRNISLTARVASMLAAEQKVIQLNGFSSERLKALFWQHRSIINTLNCVSHLATRKISCYIPSVTRC